MKGKFKKLIAGAAVLAMAAQFAFVLPASAVTSLPYTQDYESVTDPKTVWTPSPNYVDGLTLGTDKTNYIQYTTGSNNSRGATSDFEDLDLTGHEYYVVEFDMALTNSNTDNSSFGILTGGMPGANAAVSGNYLFKIDMTKGGVMTFNDISTATVTQTDSTWYHYEIIVDTTKRLVSATISPESGDKLVDKLVLPINGDVTNKITGIHFLSGRYNSVMKFDNFTVREKTDDDTFGEVAEETMSKVEFVSQVNTAIVNPPLGAENAVHKKIEVKVSGIYGTDLSNADGIEYEWTTTGLSGGDGEDPEDGYISLTKEPGSGDGDLGGTEGEAPTSTDNVAYFNVRNGVSDWFGSVNVKITYKGEEKTLSTPFATLRSAIAGDNLAPQPGYPVDMSAYKNSLVGYKVGGQNETYRDVVLNNWTIAGSNGARTLELKKDDTDGTKYLQFSTGGGTSGSTVGSYLLSNQANQYITDVKIRFTGGTGGFGHYASTANNGNANPSWTVSFTGTGLTLNGQSVVDSGMSKDEWYRIVVSADETAKVCWAKVYKNDGMLLGEAEDISINTANAKQKDGKTDEDPATPCYTLDQKYFCVTGGFPVDLASFRIYYPSIGNITINTQGGAEQLQVPAPDESDAGDNPIGESGVYTYDRVAKKLTVTKADVTKATLIAASYDGTKLTNVKTSDLTFTDSKAVLNNYVLESGAKLLMWDGLDTMEPIDNAPVTYTATPLPDAELELVAMPKTAEGYTITGAVTWEINSDDDTIQIVPDSTDSHKAKLVVKEGAPAGPVTVTARSGSANATKDINLTTSGNSIAVTAPVTSLTIPFTGGENATAEFTAKTVDKNGDDVQFAMGENGEPTETASTITYKVLDKNYTDITDTLATALPGVTFNVADGKATLTVTSAAKPARIYINAINNDATPLSRAIPVNIHGLSFSFGTGEPEEGYTQVTKADSYSDKAGYGFENASMLTDGSDKVTGSAAYKFMVKVPAGNYTVTANTTSTATYSEKPEGISTVLGVSKSGASYKVAVVDGILDLTFAANSDLKSLSIAQDTAKTELDKPAIYAIGDSTTKNNANGNISWGNVAESQSGVTLPTAFSSFHNHGMAGRNSIDFYNEGRIEAVLLAVNPGDYVTVNMGINGRESNEEFLGVMDDYCVQGIIQRGAIPVIVTATPDGPVAGSAPSWNGDYDASTQKFTNNRGTGARNGLLRKIAQDNNLNIIELGFAGEDYFNTLQTGVAPVGDGQTPLEYVQSLYGDHNHYKEPLAKWIAEYLFDCLEKIAGGDPSFNQAQDEHIELQ